MNLEGQIRIQLETHRSAPNVVLSSNRPVHASRMFVGRSPQQVIELIQRLFTLCGAAQATASLRALEQAQGQAASAQVEADRDWLVHLETAREHALRVLLDWPVWLNQTKSGDAGKTLRRLFQNARDSLFPAGLHLASDAESTMSWKQRCRCADELDMLLTSTIFGRQTGSWCSMTAMHELRAWTATVATPAATIIDEVIGRGWADAGIATTGFLPGLSPAALNERLLAADADSFIERPTWLDQPYETTPLARQKDHPLLLAVMEDCGSGLLSRLVALLLELAQLPARLRNEEIDDAQWTSSPAPAQGIGVGQVEAARGRLIHCAEVHEEQVVRYQILAPTEWNFHPRGVLFDGLSNLCDADQLHLRTKAQMLITAVDPCVGYTLQINESSVRAH